jgi:hypothetical protein
MLILVPWKPVVFVWLLLSAMFLFWAGAMCVVEGKNPFRIEKYHPRVSISHAPDRPSSHKKRATRPAINTGQETKKKRPA